MALLADTVLERLEAGDEPAAAVRRACQPGAAGGGIGAELPELLGELARAAVMEGLTRLLDLTLDGSLEEAVAAVGQDRGAGALVDQVVRQRAVGLEVGAPLLGAVGDCGMILLGEGDGPCHQAAVACRLGGAAPTAFGLGASAESAIASAGLG